MKASKKIRPVLDSSTVYPFSGILNPSGKTVPLYMDPSVEIFSVISGWLSLVVYYYYFVKG